MKTLLSESVRQWMSSRKSQWLERFLARDSLSEGGINFLTTVPLEVREQIYLHALTHHYGSQTVRASEITPPPLAYTCKQAYTESGDVFWRAFELEYDVASPRYERFYLLRKTRSVSWFLRSSAEPYICAPLRSVVLYFTRVELSVRISKSMDDTWICSDAKTWTEPSRMSRTLTRYESLKTQEYVGIISRRHQVTGAMNYTWNSIAAGYVQDHDEWNEKLQSLICPSPNTSAITLPNLDDWMSGIKSEPLIRLSQTLVGLRYRRSRCEARLRHFESISEDHHVSLNDFYINETFDKSTVELSIEPNDPSTPLSDEKRKVLNMILL